MVKIQVLFLQAFGYEQTGNPAFLERGKYLIPHIMDYQTETRLSELTAQHFIHVFNRRHTIKVSYPKLTVTNQGDGNYLLTWQPPVLPVQEYILKYSHKKIVPNLNFDSIKRAYQYDPAQYVNFWAANEPVINPDTKAASFKLTGLNSSRPYYFSLKALHRQDIVSPVAKQGDSGMPKNFELEIVNYPNPFNAQTMIRIKLDESLQDKLHQNSVLSIYNLTGQQVFSVSNLEKEYVVWDASKHASGVYIAQLKVGGWSSQVIKMLLVK